jgi:DUF1365 family protein
MHKLEYALYALSVLQREKNPELSQELLSLASASHNYNPLKGQDLSDEYIDEMHKRVDPIMYGEDNPPKNEQTE